jgi:hypothetical protein
MAFNANQKANGQRQPELQQSLEQNILRGHASR